MDLNFGNQRKVFISIKEGTNGKGIEGYFDEVALRNLSQLNKIQISNILFGALEELGALKHEDNNARTGKN